jgi:hypothetical protein
VCRRLWSYSQVEFAVFDRIRLNAPYEASLHLAAVFGGCRRLQLPSFRETLTEAAIQIQDYSGPKPKLI